MSEVSPQKDVAALAGGLGLADAEGEADTDRDGDTETEGDTLRGALADTEINGVGTAEAGATGAAAGAAVATGAHPAAAATTPTAHNEIPRFRTTALCTGRRSPST